MRAIVHHELVRFERNGKPGVACLILKENRGKCGLNGLADFT